MTTFRVVVEGCVLEGFAPDEVRRQLASLIGRSEEKAATLLSGRASTVKRGIDQSTAFRYVETLRKVGVSCHPEQETLELDLDTQEIVSGKSADATGKVTNASSRPLLSAMPDGPRNLGQDQAESKISGYVASVIGKGEQVLYRARVSVASYWFWLCIGGLFLLPGIIEVGMAAVSSQMPIWGGLLTMLIGLLFILPAMIAFFSTQLVITNRRVIAKVGLLRRSTIELNLSKIESIRVEQGLLARLLNYGNIFVIGTGGSKEPILRISHPLEFRRRYDEVLASTQGKAA